VAEWDPGGPFCIPILGPVARLVAFPRLRIAKERFIPAAGVVNRTVAADFFNGLNHYPTSYSFSE
jgi:hypothetical protein